MKRSAIYSLAAVAVVLSAISFAIGDPTELKGKVAPDFTLTTLDGASVKLSSLKGKVVMVDFWATWCPPCRKSLPHVQKVADDKALADKGLKVFAVNAHEKSDTVKDFLTKNKYTFTVPMDADAAAMKAYGVEGIPTTIIVNKDGTIGDVFVGYGDGSAEQIDAALTKALSN